ncbi:MAG: hypothetical protein K0S33_3039 [Bacteroidetes bacterium]|jgi:hypothetical protein|nr:hypothetical protein [Bacteroidota bacterium]
MAHDDTRINPASGYPFFGPPVTLYSTLSAIAIVLLIFYCSRRHTIKSGRQAVAVISDTALYTGNRVNIYYTFTAGERSRTDSKVYDKLDHKDAACLMHKRFVVLYNPSNPKKNELLMNKEDFEDAGRKQPDSLKCFNPLFDF